MQLRNKMVVTRKHCENALVYVEQIGARRATVRLSDAEPELITHVEAGMGKIWDKVREYGLIKSRGWNGGDDTLYPTILTVIVSSIAAMREGQLDHLAHLARRRRASRHLHAKSHSADGVVPGHLLDEVESLLWPVGHDRALQHLQATQPELFTFVQRVSATIDHMLDIARVAETGVSIKDKRAVQEQIQTMAAICAEAVFRSSFTPRQGG